MGGKTAAVGGGGGGGCCARFGSYVALLLGLLFIVAFGAAVLVTGLLRGWLGGAADGERFAPEPPSAEAAANHYYWQLPVASAGARASAWLLYAAHQVAVWAALYWAQRARGRTASAGEKRAPGLWRYNAVALGVNALFHVVHLVQTHTLYAPLAQDTPVASSQGSVIMLLVFVLVMEFRDRGLLFGWPSPAFGDRFTARVGLRPLILHLVRRYHGYAFLWAAVYTFWYHPCEPTWGHVLGFAHTAAIMLQGSLAYTEAHLNRYWRFALEVWVVLHSGVVAWQTGGAALLGTGLWPMFVFGFLFLVVVTQLFGLWFWRRLPFAVRLVPFALYIAALLYCYSWIPDASGAPWVRLPEFVRIPGLEYLFVIVSLLLLWGASALVVRLLGDVEPPPGDVQLRGAALAALRTDTWAPLPRRRAALLVPALLVYALLIGIGVAVHVSGRTPPLFVLMIALVFVYLVGCVATFVLLALAQGDDLRERKLQPAFARDYLGVASSAKTALQEPGEHVELAVRGVSARSSPRLEPQPDS